MNYNINWNMVSAVGTCLGALATFCACFIALWQTRIAYKKKIKLTFSDNITITDMNAKINIKLVSVTIYNTGNKDIEIRELAIHTNNKSKYILIQEVIPFVKLKLPHRLNTESSVDLMYEYNRFVPLLQEMLQKNEIYKWNKIKFGIKDSSNKVYYIKSSKRVYQYINEYTKMRNLGALDE